MAYRLDPGRPTPLELRRVLAEQLGAAAELLSGATPPAGEDLHDTRTHVKKARAVLRLARGDVGVGIARHANGELRTVNRSLAGARDLDSLVECLDRLADAAADDTERAAIASVRTVLADPGVSPGGDVGPEALTRSRAHQAAAALQRTASWIERVPPRDEGWAALAVGFEREYRRGRRRRADLGDDPTPEQLHEWRKRVKDLWYHQRLLRDLWPAAQHPIRAGAKRLASTLGDDHDLAVLRRVLVDGGRPVAGPDRDLVISLVDAERLRLLVGARELGGYLYADEPGAWVARHGAWWGQGLTCDGGPRP